MLLAEMAVARFPPSKRGRGQMLLAATPMPTTPASGITLDNQVEGEAVVDGKFDARQIFERWACDGFLGDKEDSIAILEFRVCRGPGLHIGDGDDRPARHGQRFRR